MKKLLPFADIRIPPLILSSLFAYDLYVSSDAFQEMRNVFFFSDLNLDDLSFLLTCLRSVVSCFENNNQIGVGKHSNVRASSPFSLTLDKRNENKLMTVSRCDAGSSYSVDLMFVDACGPQKVDV